MGDSHTKQTYFAIEQSSRHQMEVKCPAKYSVESDLVSLLETGGLKPPEWSQVGPRGGNIPGLDFPEFSLAARKPNEDEVAHRARAAKELASKCRGARGAIYNVRTADFFADFGDFDFWGIGSGFGI